MMRYMMLILLQGPADLLDPDLIVEDVGDMARFGLLYLEKGRIGNRRIVSEKWVEESTKNQRGFTTSWKEMTNVGYGYQWWTGKIRDYEIYFASGMGGQWILNIPKLNMVVVSTMNGSTEKGNKQMESLMSLLDRYIIPSVINEK